MLWLLLRPVAALDHVGMSVFLRCDRRGSRVKWLHTMSRYPERQTCESLQARLD